MVGGRHGRVVPVRAGDRYSALTVVEELHHAPYDHRVIACRCECGNQTVARLDHLRRGETRSCGCAIGRPYETAPTVDAPEVPLQMTTAQEALDREFQALQPFGVTAASRRRDGETEYVGRAITLDDEFQEES